MIRIVCLNRRHKESHTGRLKVSKNSCSVIRNVFINYFFEMISLGLVNTIWITIRLHTRSLNSSCSLRI